MAEASIDRELAGVLKLVARVGGLQGFDAVQAEPAGREDPIACAREAFAADTVMVKDDGVLPHGFIVVSRAAVFGRHWFGGDARSAGLWPPVRAAAGETVTAILDVPVRLLSYWDNGWTYGTGD